MKKHRIRPDFFGILCLIIGYLAGVIQENSEHSHRSYIVAATPMNRLCNAPDLSNNLPTKNDIIAEMRRARVASIDIAWRQIEFETGHLNPKTPGMKRNNLFCLTRDSLMRFDTWQESVWYYKIWQKHLTKYRGKTDNAYLAHLKKYWRGHEEYVEQLMGKESL